MTNQAFIDSFLIIRFRLFEKSLYFHLLHKLQSLRMFAKINIAERQRITANVSLFWRKAIN